MASSESFMFSVESSVTLHLCFIACGPVVFDVFADIYASIDVVVKVMGKGLIDLLVVVATLTS